MAWITLTSDDIERRLSAPEFTALTTAAVKSGQTASGLIASAIDSVAAQVRGYVAACERNVLGETGTIPDELEDATLALLRRHLFTRLPGLKALYDDARRQETDDALRLLRDVARCDYAIVAPATRGAAQAAGGGVSLVASGARAATTSALDAL